MSVLIVVNNNDVILVIKMIPDVLESVGDDHDAHVYQITRGYIKHLNSFLLFGPK